MKLNKMRKTALFAMCYGCTYKKFEGIMIHKAKKRYIKKAWKQAKQERQRIKAMTFAHRYGVGTPRPILEAYDRVLSFNRIIGTKAELLIFDEVYHEIH